MLWQATLRPRSFLSTLSLRRATFTTVLHWYHMSNFYPRSPCGERRRSLCQADSRGWHFYPRSPCGERPLTVADLGKRNVRISIHALLAESDISALYASCPRALFLSTLSLRRATEGGQIKYAAWYISIHALLAESDKHTKGKKRKTNKFLSTLSLRRATFDRDQQNGDRPDFYPRSPCGERHTACIIVGL